LSERRPGIGTGRLYQARTSVPVKISDAHFKYLVIRSAVITRLDRAIQYPEIVVLNREAAAYWIARLARAMTTEDEETARLFS
jgi:hypothetical protein